MKLVALLVASLFCFTSMAPLQGAVLSFEELVGASDIIVRAKIDYIEFLSKDEKSGVVDLNNFAVVQTVFKGDITPMAQINVKTSGKVAEVPSFKEGSMQMLFLKKNTDHYVINGGLQGSWPVFEGQFGGFGQGKSAQDIIECVKMTASKEFEQSLKETSVTDEKTVASATETISSGEASLANESDVHSEEINPESGKESSEPETEVSKENEVENIDSESDIDTSDQTSELSETETNTADTNETEVSSELSDKSDSQSDEEDLEQSSKEVLLEEDKPNSEELQ